MFLGTYTPKLDDKGRLTLPAKFRDELAGGLMVTKGQDHSLAVYPREEFAERARKAAAVSRTNPEARAFIRNLAASADEQRPDGHGRITLSAAHRSYAGLTKECVVIGSVDFLEIWDAESWAAYQKETEEAFSAADADDVLGGLL
ncbi:division/cell wall cluster transcriptional repressor MraZ [Corynebacterium mastitidis]|uniref:Transcriptional regulator MraZ n=1 Tax=Corynebacterium mastitidis TaxID=161890 RepID=A0A2N0X9K7_9CORY|nr:division/cell wall cluster transcriptional repressor MraZ [Corynebacterium mastitidis]MCH6196794.1 division/cell wall cluster transcriptional repressor MraZ [Corynebacterium mastitidis]MDK8449547.1 division/cell wall cluster transcriptional repressor MraZ [Corynebacterium mastitidis]PKF69382.1 transcriptional regulator MraZ [Corynebacterium mastitidis]